MIGGLVALAIAAIGAAYAGLVLRAAPTRRDNIAFGALAMTDAAMTAWRGLNVLAGDAIVDSAVTLPCSIATITLGVLTVEFITGFPRRKPMSWAWRVPLLLWALAGMISVALEYHYRASYRFTQWTMFFPITLLIFYVGYRAWKTTTDRAERTVIAMLWFRWGFGFSAYFFSPMLDLFEGAVWAETTFATLVSFVVIGTAVLRSELFSLRSSAAEAITIATFALIVVLGGGAAVWAIQRWTEASTLQNALFVGATLVPLGLAGLGSSLYPRVERRVLANLDERRARRLGVQGDPLPADASAAIDEATRRIASIADGSTVRWIPAPAIASEVSAAHLETLRAGEPLRRDEAPELPACFIVPARGADGTLVGAFHMTHGLIDRDTYLVARDLAARVAVAVERDEAVSALEDARRLAALGQFAAAIAHDIRTPLTSISLNVQILRSKLALPEDDREHLDIALEELQRLDRSVAEILDFAKPVRLASESVDVGDLIETAAHTLSPVLSEKNIALETEPAALTVQGDRQRLRQVLVNLVGNAAEASRPGAKVRLRAVATADRHVAIEVEDQGRGIGADDLPRIFEPFFTTRPDGTGLGLAICHKVVRAHGGDIKVRSTVGQGSTFTVMLPAA
ncbi:MAG TPA: ATP-binding protein [Kofleriaceae bacterium]|nr:ATP-binding protein [Kofleriaceae bacterium]